MRLIQGDSLATLKTLDAESVQCCVTSPPYWGLRDYGAEGQLGLEKTPEEYVANMVAVFREVGRVLRGDGTLWLNLGDSYASTGGTGGQGKHGERFNRTHTQRQLLKAAGHSGLKAKDLVGIPWMVAFALRADGWYLRSDIIWSKPNPMPESVRDRPTKSHEYLFLLAKSESYFYDVEAVKETATDKRGPGNVRVQAVPGERRGDNANVRGSLHKIGVRTERNRRTVWTVTTSPFKGAHFATFPPKLITPCILAGSRPGDTVLDPFNGAGTTGLVALQHRRDYIGIDINPEYLEMTRKRLALVQQELFTRGATA